MSNIDLSFQEQEAETITWHSSKKKFRAHLRTVWELPNIEKMASQESKSASSSPRLISEKSAIPYVSKQSWVFACSEAFDKQVLKYDAKLRGRFLTCIMKILRAPMTPIGDTIKPLEGDKKGLWRYREGDYRIVYLPNKANFQVFFVDVDSRGEIYK